ncbi:MAG: MerR family transcriptional regulator [Pseudomonas sp.]
MISTHPFVQAIDLERETGLSKDLLRKWRSRYGFPHPIQQEPAGSGYPREQITQLCLIKRLLDVGFRPAQVVGKQLEELERLAQAVAVSSFKPALCLSAQAALERLRVDDVDGLEKNLAQALIEQGLTGFVQQTAGPLMAAVGTGWACGEIQVYQEHLCSAVLMRLLFAAISAIKPLPGHPRILFATPPEELHVLGLLMLQAVQAEHGAHCLHGGTQLSLDELAKAARAYRADVVALSFSGAYPQRRVRPFLIELRARLPDAVQLWTGGAGVASIKRAPAGVRVFSGALQPVEFFPGRAGPATIVSLPGTSSAACL